MKRGKIKGTKIKTRAIKCMPYAIGEHPCPWSTGALSALPDAEGDQDLGIKTLPNIKFFNCYNNLKHTN